MTNRMNNGGLLSAVVPCYNEEQVLDETHRVLSDALQKIDIDYEIVYVNDGSRDRTLEILAQLQLEDYHVRVVSLSRNFGHQMAVSAGVDSSAGDAVVLIDADLQDPPALIAEMVEKWREGYDVVYGMRASRQGESRFKKWSAGKFYRVLNKLSDVAIPLDTGDFRLMSRRVVDSLASMPERDRFIRGMVSWVDFRQCAIPYARAERFAGESKYPLRKMIAFAVDGLLSFSLRPLRVALKLGFLTSGIAAAGILYAVGIRLFTDVWVSGWTLMISAVLFLGGVQLICLGIIGEYVGRTYNESKRRPLYLVDKFLGFDDSGVALSGNRVAPSKLAYYRPRPPAQDRRASQRPTYHG